MTDEISSNRRRALELVAVASLPVFVVVTVVMALLAGPLVGVLAGAVLAVATGLWVRRAALGMVRRSLSGRPADLDTDARLHNLVDGLCMAVGVPKPDLLVIDEPGSNALSAGLEPRHALLAVTRGMLESLSRVELEGVVARELARIKNHDTGPATIAVPLLAVAGSIRPLGDRIVRVAVGAASPAVADMNGVTITRYPPGLAGALGKVAAGPGLSRRAEAIDHLWLQPPVAGGASDIHQPLDERIAALREL